MLQTKIPIRMKSNLTKKLELTDFGLDLFLNSVSKWVKWKWIAIFILRLTTA